MGDRGRAGPNVRPGYPFFLLRSYHRYSSNNRSQTFHSSYCAENTDNDQKTNLFLFKFYFMLYTQIRTTFFYRSTRTMIVFIFKNILPTNLSIDIHIEIYRPYPKKIKGVHLCMLYLQILFLKSKGSIYVCFIYRSYYKKGKGSIYICFIYRSYYKKARGLSIYALSLQILL